MTYALISSIEGNIHNLNQQKGIVKFDRMYEDEAVMCFRNWRRNAGWLKDIPIYTMCPTRNTISRETQHKLSELGVTYIEEFHPITDTFTSGFINIPYTGMIFEGMLSEDVLIKIDLDMNIIRPLPQELVDSSVVVCGQYDDYCSKLQRHTNGQTNPFDTGFMISRRESGVYKTWFDGIVDIMSNGVVDRHWESVREKTGEYYLEEYVMDKMYNEGVVELYPIQKYQIGEWYTPVSVLSDEELSGVYFWHEHILHDPRYDKVREKIEYFKRMKVINDKL